MLKVPTSILASKLTLLLSVLLIKMRNFK